MSKKDQYIIPIINKESAETFIDFVRQFDFTSVSYDEAFSAINTKIQGYQVKTSNFQPGIQLYRGRLCDKPTHIKELLYPPAHLTKIGRVNRPVCPVLYCCNARSGVFFETRPNEGDEIAIASWKTTAPLLVNHVGYTSTTFQKLGSSRTVAGWSSEPALIVDDEACQLISDYFSNLFTRVVDFGSEDEFRVTVAIAECLFSGEPFDGLLYPSIAMRANANNIVLKPRYADNNLEFIKAENHRVDKIKEFGYETTWLDLATELTEDGEIMWKGRPGQWVLRNQGDALTFTIEDGQRVARDVSGQIVEPE